MSMDISSFRNVSSSGFFELDREINYDADSKTLAKGSSSLASRVRGWANSLIGNNQPDQKKIQANIGAKLAFLNALSRSEGAQNAERALCKAGLPRDWETNSQPLTSRQISTMLDSAQHYRMGIVRHNEKALANILQNETDYSQRDLRSNIITAVKSHPDYGQKILTPDVLKDILKDASDTFDLNQFALTSTRFPGLALWLHKQPTSSPDGVRPIISPGTAVNEAKKLLSPDMASAANQAMQLLERTTELLSKSAWNQEGLQALGRELSDHVRQFDAAHNALNDQYADLSAKQTDLKSRLEKFGTTDPKNPSNDLPAEPAELMKQWNTASNKMALIEALQEDLGHQLKLIEAKQTFLEEIRLNNPLSERAVAYSNLVWTQVAALIIDDVATQVSTLNPLKGIHVKTQAKKWVSNVLTEVKQAYEKTAKQDANSSVPAPTKENKSNHPVVASKKKILDELRDQLRSVGAPPEVIARVTDKTSLRNAHRLVLAALVDWQPVDRDMLIVRDGAVQSYKSKITPAQHLDDRFKASYTVDGIVHAVASAETDHPDNHARNLKVSELFDPQGNRMMAVVGHGVLDMWKITDPNARIAANTAGAKEVLEAALATNPRLVNTINTARQTDSPTPPPRLTHVSINLTSPDTLRSTWLGLALNPDSTEKDYTRAQFAAFEANSGPGKKLQLIGGEPVSVDVDTITFSFGINLAATNPLLSTLLMGVWNNVHAHNTVNMVKLIGDLGQGEFGARGTPPGGFIGEVYDKAQAAGQTALMHELRVQTDVVRELFTTNAFMEGRGDTAKMGREILVLQTLAEKTLDLIGATDMAATMSKGCKSDKDRGGVMDVELKSKLILQGMGGDMAPDTRLVGDDQQLYYAVSASSGQLENQRWNTGLGGSKETGHITERLPDLQARQYMSGLGAFAVA